MSRHFLVCPADDDLIRRLQGMSLVIRINEPSEISRVIQLSNRYHFYLHAIWLKTDAPVTAFPFQKKWEGLPIALYAAHLGNFPEFMRQLTVMRRMNLRIYLPAHFRENFVSLRILASLGLKAAVVFDEKKMAWKQMTDLATYALLNLVPHAPLEPFNYIANNYDIAGRTDFGAVYFKDPTRYLHLDAEGRIALSPEEIGQGRFLPLDLSELDRVENCAAYNNWLHDWMDYFLEPEGCAFCQGWRVCLGKFSAVRDQGCADFFIELMEVVEQYISQKKKRTVIWQP